MRERDDGVEVREYNGNITADEDICFTCRKKGEVSGPIKERRQENSYV